MVTKAKILQAAKRRIKSGKEEFICIAILDATIGTMEQKKKLTAWISKMLDGHSTYENWLRKHHPAFATVCDVDATAGRLQWLNWMIKQVGESS